MELHHLTQSVKLFLRQPLVRPRRRGWTVRGCFQSARAAFLSGLAVELTKGQVRQPHGVGATVHQIVTQKVIARGQHHAAHQPDSLARLWQRLHRSEILARLHAAIERDHRDAAVRAHAPPVHSSGLPHAVWPLHIRHRFHASGENQIVNHLVAFQVYFVLNRVREAERMHPNVVPKSRVAADAQMGRPSNSPSRFQMRRWSRFSKVS